MVRMRYLALVAAALLVVSCAGESVNTPTETGTVITKSDLRPDSTVGWLYYSFATDAVVPADSIDQQSWDIKLPFLTINSRTIDIMLNSGTVGRGSTMGLVVEARWETIASVAPTWSFRSDDTLAVNRVVPNCVMCPQTMFVYSGPPNHAIIPSPDKVLVLRLADGTFVKLQVTSIYQGAVANPLATTPIGYYSIRYVKGLPTTR